MAGEIVGGQKEIVIWMNQFANEFYLFIYLFLVLTGEIGFFVPLLKKSKKLTKEYNVCTLLLPLDSGAQAEAAMRRWELAEWKDCSFNSKQQNETSKPTVSLAFRNCVR